MNLRWLSIACGMIVLTSSGCASYPSDCEPYFNTDAMEQCIEDYEHDMKLRREAAREKQDALTSACTNAGMVWTCSGRIQKECGCVSKDEIRSALSIPGTVYQ